MDLGQLLKGADVGVRQGLNLCLVAFRGGVIDCADPKARLLRGLNGVQGVLKHHGILLVGLKAPHGPLVNFRTLRLSGAHLAAGQHPAEIGRNARVSQPRLRQMAVGVGGHIHRNALHLQKREKAHHTGLWLHLMVIKRLHLPLGHGHNFVYTLGKMVALLAVLGAVPKGQDLQGVIEIGLWLHALSPQGVGAQIGPDMHRVQQGAVHIKNCASQPHKKPHRFSESWHRCPDSRGKPLKLPEKGWHGPASAWKRTSRRSGAPGRNTFAGEAANGKDQQSLAPAGIASSTIRRCSRSSPCSVWTAEISIPQLSWPIIFLGGRFTMATSVLPTSSSGL